MDTASNYILIEKAVSTKQLLAIETIAAKIWHQHYKPIIGEKQVEYMLTKFQSLDAMNAQIKDGFSYYQVKLEKLAGYFAIQKRGNHLFISKFYVHSDFRGKGLASKMIKYIEDLAKSSNCDHLSLTVNKYNLDTISIYEHFGFAKAREVIFEIGEGYIMDDFEMIKELP